MTSREPASQCSIVDKCIIIRFKLGTCSSVKNEDTIPTDNAFNSDQRQESAASSISRLLLLVKAEISLEHSYLTDPPQNKSEAGRQKQTDTSDAELAVYAPLCQGRLGRQHACMSVCLYADMHTGQQQYVGPFSPLTAVHAEKTTSPQLLAGRALPTLSLATINPYTKSVACCQLTVNLGQQQQHHHQQQQQQQQQQEVSASDHAGTKNISSRKSASVTGPSGQEEGGTAEQLTSDRLFVPGCETTLGGQLQLNTFRLLHVCKFETRRCRRDFKLPE
ncbi:hypothetical protein T4B_5615 [Trichinella pseudospiralis]|uniref:Uncharacterized protein n=1 Tax=Trichinella pseudospiralis TaxID=6337 RepID=A0A0V1JJ14_TRIPS|nr:hypothetical protein T4A_7204 [Trichinella pseudospiralis]KRZ34984.1 hypothetical protein T4B_5615 [Trichinella pseudospiralis]KRZ44165.1 hypothetical protein T4C_13641 [Trichinella pseudospiralis]